MTLWPPGGRRALDKTDDGGGMAQPDANAECSAEVAPALAEEGGVAARLPVQAPEPSEEAAALQEGATEQLVQLHEFADQYADRGQYRQTAKLAYRVVKRAFNIVFSLCVIAILLVPSALLCLAIALDTKGSPIYVHERVGYRGRRIGVLKFRSMVADADDLEKYLTPEQIREFGREHKLDDDPRVTRLGHFLRKSSVDEFPQFVNVLLGQMNVVGPRPVTAEELSWFGDDVDELLSCHPGITGLWQTLERNDATYQTGVRQEMELTYVRKRCLKMDFDILARTLGVMVRKTGK